MAKKSITQIMRNLHRDIGYLFIGFIILFALSGIVLIFRDTDLLKKEKVIERQLPANLDESQLGQELHMRRFEVEKVDGDTMWFSSGWYNSKTGEVNFSVESLPNFVSKMNGFHKLASNNKLSLLSLLVAIALVFLAVSSFWMHKPGSKRFRRGFLLAGVGIVVALVLVLL